MSDTLIEELREKILWLLQAKLGQEKEIKVLKDRVLEREKEVERLKEKIRSHEKEIKRADTNLERKRKKVMMKVIRPVGDKVLVRPDSPEEVSEGGIVIPDGSRQSPGRGKVLSVGCDVEETKEGNIVFYNKYDVTGVEVDGDDFVVLSEEKILLRITEE